MEKSDTVRWWRILSPFCVRCLMTIVSEMKKPWYIENLITITIPRRTTFVAFEDPFPGPIINHSINKHSQYQ